MGQSAHHRGDEGRSEALASMTLAIAVENGAMSHEPRLTQALRELISRTRVAALGTVDDQGLAFVSMVPFAVAAMADERPQLVIHVSALAVHSSYLRRQPQVSLLLMQAEIAGEPVHALPRVTLQGRAAVLPPGSAAWTAARGAYLARFPEAEPITALPDFSFVGITVDQARQVAGFGAARTVEREDVEAVLRRCG